MNQMLLIMICTFCSTEHQFQLNMTLANIIDVAYKTIRTKKTISVLDIIMFFYYFPTFQIMFKNNTDGCTQTPIWMFKKRIKNCLLTLFLKIQGEGLQVKKIAF